MKSTGIVRRIDELGRVVIPKELRKTMHMREGEELEVYTDGDARLVFEKYSPVKSLMELAGHYVEAVNRNYGLNIAVADRDRIVAFKGDAKSIVVGAKITTYGEELMGRRKSAMVSGTELKSVCGESFAEVGTLAVAPIVRNGDLLGGVFIFARNILADSNLRLAATVAELIAMQA